MCSRKNRICGAGYCTPHVTKETVAWSNSITAVIKTAIARPGTKIVGHCKASSMALQC